MAFANLNLLPEIHPPYSSSSSSVHFLLRRNYVVSEDHRQFTSPSGATFLRLLEISRRIVVSSSLPIRRRDRAFQLRKWRVTASTLRVVDNNVNVNVNGRISAPHAVEIPVSCYQSTCKDDCSCLMLGVPDQAEKDQIVKSVMDLRNAEIEEGFTMEAVISRRDLLMDVRDKLLFEPEYAGNLREKVPPKSSLRIPWPWLPGALCLLQEVGEEKLVLEIGRAALPFQDAQPYVHDLLLSMALAECAIAKMNFEKNHISQGFEALARAQCLLRSEISLGKMKLLSQIEESLEELAPACTLQLLGMPHTPDNAERRCGAIAALRELLRQGLDAETSCRVHDWPCFLSQALSKLMAAEVVDLLPWDNLAVTRKNKKSLESQNQRVVIDFDCFYVVLLAHIALGFSSRQTDLINNAQKICECLVASEGIDLKFEEAFCLFLLGQVDEAEALERLQQLELNANQKSRSPILAKKTKDVHPPNLSLEMWLKDAVLGLFPDTCDCSSSLANFFGRDKKAMGSKQNKGVSQTLPSVNHRPLSPSLSLDRRVPDERLPSQHLGPAVKQLAPADFQSPLLEAKTCNQNSTSIPSSQLKRNLGSHLIKAGWSVPRQLVERATLITVLGCIVFTTGKLLGMQSGRMTASKWVNGKANWTTVSSVGKYGVHSSSNYSSAEGMKKLLSLFRIRFWSRSNAGNQQNSCLTASLSSPLPVVYNRPMAVEEAEALVRQWQTIKAEALGPDHQVDLLSDVLEEPMLLQALADTAKARLCFWRFVLLQLAVLRAEILSDNVGPEMAEIEVFLEEAAELVDDSLEKNPNYYSQATNTRSSLARATAAELQQPNFLLLFC
ncbi:hypothetical protein Ancab_036019 [Ancistrocladus abbreviatus]